MSRKEDIQAALKVIEKDGMSVRCAAKAFSVPYSTLRDHSSGKQIHFSLHKVVLS